MRFRGLTLPDVPYDYRLQSDGFYSVRLKVNRPDDPEARIEIAQVMFSTDAVHKSLAMQAFIDALNAAAAVS